MISITSDEVSGCLLVKGQRGELARLVPMPYGGYWIHDLGTGPAPFSPPACGTVEEIVEMLREEWEGSLDSARAISRLRVLCRSERPADQ